MVTDLQKRVIDRKKKLARRLRKNYQLSRAYGYTSEEASLLMNQSHKTIIYNAVKDGRIPQGSPKPLLWDDLLGYCNEIHLRHFPGGLISPARKDVTNERSE
jgi:hypothetical protein